MSETRGSTDPPPVAPAERSDNAPHWLLRQRVSVPPPPTRYCPRPDLAERCAPARDRVTLLAAPGGFGKTTLLADRCRQAAAAGTPVAWLTLADDEPEALDAYVAFAFQRTGLELSTVAPDIPVPHPRTAHALAAFEASGRPGVLVLDELESAAGPGAVAFLDDLLRNLPPRLHVALAYRTLPPGLDAVAGLLAAGASVLTAEDLRFSRADIARFFDLQLSRRALAAVTAESGGWPIALQMRRNASDVDAHVASGAVDGWFDGAFWRGFAPGDRDRVLDLSLLDWVDAELLDEVLGEPGAFARLAALPGLAGLLLPVRGGVRSVHRLHPLLRHHCAERHRRENPHRYRTVQRRIAAAMARRGATVDAMRHAAEAGDPALAGRILLDAGGLDWWLAEGGERLAAACRYITDEQAAVVPRLGLARCVDLMLRGRVAEANQAYAAAVAMAPAHDPALTVDRLLTQGRMAMSGTRRLAGAEIDALVANALRVAGLPSTPRLSRGGLFCGAAAHHAATARFDAAITLAGSVRRLILGRSTYLAFMAGVVLGQTAMARGRVRDAARHYRSARRLARERFLEDPRMTVFADVLIYELALERNRLADEDAARRTARRVYRSGAQIAHYAAASSLAVELAAARDGTDAALAAIDDTEEQARSAVLAALRPLLAALRVSVLVDAGLLDEADRAWGTAGFPDGDDRRLLDFDKPGPHGWQGVEALAGARVRLLAARGDGAVAQRLEHGLATRAAERGLVRTVMRSLALRVQLRHDAGDTDGAAEAVMEYLHRFASTDYARPLIRTGRAAADALERVLDQRPAPRFVTAATRLLAMTTPPELGVPRLDGREMAVLRRLTTPDKEIARALGLSVHGVRYHVRKIFRKLGVRSRAEATRRARGVGILPPGG